MNKRMNRNKLNIGAYYLRGYARTEQHFKDLSDCGIDFIAAYGEGRKELDLFEKYGIGAFLYDACPGWWGGNGDNAGTMKDKNPLSVYDEAAAKFEDHPAVWGIDIGDEPSALDFEHYGKVFNKVNTVFPNQFPYLNLYPNYASVSENTAEQTVSQLGTATYEEHIERYCQNVPADYICFDYYPYASNIPGFYSNLRVVSDAARNTGRSMWIVLQVNSNKPEKWISKNMLRFQAFNAMAFGAENIIWACYTAGWWHNQVLDKEGNKTEQYEKLKEINGEIKYLAEKYMRYRRTETHFVGFENSEFAPAKKSVKSLSTGAFYNLRASDGAPLTVGEMVSRAAEGARAVMVCPCDDPYDTSEKQFDIIFSVDSGRTVFAYGGKGKLPVTKLESGEYSVPAGSNKGIFIEIR